MKRCLPFLLHGQDLNFSRDISLSSVAINVIFLDFSNLS